MSSSSEIQYGRENRGFPVRCACGLRVKPFLSNVLVVVDHGLLKFYFGSMTFK